MTKIDKIRQRFIKCEGDIYRVDDIPNNGMALFILKDGKWKEQKPAYVAQIEWNGQKLDELEVSKLPK